MGAAARLHVPGAGETKSAGTVDGIMTMNGYLGEIRAECGWDRSWVVYLEHPATRSSMPGDVRRCPQPTISVDRTRLVSFSVRKTSLGSGHCDVHCAGARSFFVPMIMFRCKDVSGPRAARASQ